MSGAIAPTSGRTERKRSSAEPTGVSRDMQIAARAAGVDDDDDSSEEDDSSDDDDDDESAAPVANDLLVAAQAAGLYEST